MSEKITETIFNLTTEITNIINNILENKNYITQNDLTNAINNNNTSLNDVSGNNPLLNNYVTTSNLNTQLTDYVTTTNATSTYVNKNDIITDVSTNNDDENKLVTNQGIIDYVATEMDEVINLNLSGHSFRYPLETEISINRLINAGYYKYVGTDTVSFTCAPDICYYNNGLIRVERQGNYIIQHVYSTTQDTNNVYQIDGREFVRHGYVESDGGTPNINWDDWKVSFLPWRNRDDLLDNTPENGIGENVDPNSFHIYECTAGYVFQWTQQSANHKFILPQNQYTYTRIYGFKQSLPILGPMIFSNFIGHIDIKISNNKVELRSSNNKNEYVVGVDGTYFVPRTN